MHGSFISLTSCTFLESGKIKTRVTMSTHDQLVSDATPPPVLSRRLYWSPRMLCLTTKSVIIILLWIFVVACVLRGIQYAGILAVTSINKGQYQPAKLSFIYMVLFFAFMALIKLSYPVGGFIADVYCGRYRTAATSLIFIWVAFLLLGFAIIITLAMDINNDISGKRLKVILTW